MEKNQSIKHLYNKFLNNSISKEEYKELLYHFGTDLSFEQLQQIVLQVLERDDEETIITTNQSRIDYTVKNVKAKLHSRIKIIPNQKRNLVRQFIPYAAAALILIIGVVSYLFLVHPNSQSIASVNIEPGSNKALLKLHNGEVIILSEKQEGIHTTAGLITYADGTNIKSETGMQTVSLSTPVAGQYQVQLPDGTKAWLNSLSSITYPTSFTGNQRKISITGEVYLEVSKDATKKFMVTIKNQEIEVLGTSFNINTYEDDGGIYTTLAEGSLKVTSTSDGTTVRLKPGDQAAVLKGKAIVVRQIDVNEIISWKDGFYLIKNQPLSVFCKQIERWYNVEMDMGSKGDLHLSAMIPRDVNLFEVLQAIELKTGIKFKIEGRRITVQ